MHGKPQVGEVPTALTTTKPPTPRAATVAGRADGDTTPRGGTTRNGAPGIAQHQLHVAMTWHHRGHPVIPCSRADKGPLIPGFGRDASPEQLAKFSNPEQIRAWWTGRFKRAHVGILTRRLVVVDLDMPKVDAAPPGGRWAGCQSGMDVLELLMREASADWPETYTVLTPSGGHHLYFEQPDGEPIGCATGEGPTAPHLGPLADVRGGGGLVIAAGSYSAAQGTPYTRTSPPGLRPQPLPGWLLALLLRPDTPPATPRAAPPPVRLVSTATRADRYAAAALQGEVEDVASAREGERNRRLFAAARRLGELHATAPGVLLETVVTDQLLAATLAAGLRGGEREALRTIRSGWGHGLRDGAGRGAGAA